MDKNKISEHAYHDPLGYGSIQNTLRDARKLDSSTTLDDVKKWKEANVEQPKPKQQRGYNSFVAHKPYQEFQVGLFFMNGLPGKKYNVAMLMVDIFTKYTEAVPIKDKTDGSILSALMDGFNKMGGKPETIYSDDETALSSTNTKNLGKWHTLPGNKDTRWCR